MTTAAVPSTDPVDFLLNVETLDEAINSSGPNLVDRLGNTRSTLSGAIDSLKAFNVRGAWFAATAYAIKDIYTNSGIAYVTVVAHTSTSIAADLAAGYVTVHQGMTREDLSAPSGASLVWHLPPEIAAVASTVGSSLNNPKLNLFRFLTEAQITDYKARTYTLDLTTPITVALVAAVAAKRELEWPAGGALVTGSLPMPTGTRTFGDTSTQYNNGFGSVPGGTTINFQPGSPNTDLWVADGATTGGFRFHISLAGFYMIGNANARYALNLDHVIYGSFKDLSVSSGGFQAAVYCNGTINNRLTNIYNTGTTAAVIYAGNNETTDVWEHCSFWGSPIGVQTLGSSIGVRFSHCLFEQIQTYGANLTKETQNFIFETCYAEDICYAGVSTNAMFRVGFDGTTSSGATQLTVIGGSYAGRSAGTVGAFITTDTINGVVVYAPEIKRFTTGILTSANTPISSVLLGGFVAQSITTLISDPTKIAGSYAADVYNSATKNAQSARYHALTVATSMACATLVTNTVSPTSSYFGSSTDNTKNLGLSNLRWATVYAGTGAINTSDAREKTPVRPMTVEEINAAKAIGSEIGAYSFLSAVASKGVLAREHIGMTVQRVIEIMQAHSLDPFNYGFVCYDTWSDEFIDHPAIEASDGIEAVAAWTEQTQTAGDRYSFRMDELMMFISRGFGARLAALEQK